MTQILKKEIQKRVKRQEKQEVENQILEIFKKYNLSHLLTKIKNDLYCIDLPYDRLYFWFKKDERFSLKSVFVNTENNTLLRWWGNVAVRVENLEDREKTFLIFSKSYYPFLIIMHHKVLDTIIDRISLKAYLKFYSEFFDSVFYICLLEEFLKSLSAL